MKELLLTDQQAKDLIEIIKTIAKQHNVTLSSKSSGEIDIVGERNTRFILNYFYSENNEVFNFRETDHNYTLIRINLNNKFHKNADGEKIYGNRINIFSEEEYFQKADDITHCRTYPLPFFGISNSDDFLKIISELFICINVNNPNNASIKIQEDLV